MKTRFGMEPVSKFSRFLLRIRWFNLLIGVLLLVLAFFYRLWPFTTPELFISAGTVNLLAFWVVGKLSRLQRN